MLTGVILAGRMQPLIRGRLKPLLSFSGEEIINRQIRVMKKICPEVIVVTDQPRTFLPVVSNDIRIITDYYPNRGPLGGMHAAFTLSRYPVHWVVGCDMPFISDAAARILWEWLLSEDLDAALPKIGDRIYPLHGLYQKRCIDTITRMVIKGTASFSQLMNKIHYKAVEESEFVKRGVDLRFVDDFDNAEEYEKLLTVEQ